VAWTSVAGLRSRSDHVWRLMVNNERGVVDLRRE